MDRELEDLKFIKKKNTECLDRLRVLSREIEEIISFVKLDKEWKENNKLGNIENQFISSKSELVDILNIIDIYLGYKIREENKNEW